MNWPSDFRAWTVFCTILYCGVPAFAGAPSCPLEIRFIGAGVTPADEKSTSGCNTNNCVDPERLLDLPPGWAASFQPSRLRLNSIGFSSGPPNELAFLQPQTVVREKNATRVTTFLEGGPKEKFWVNCTYEGRIVKLAKKLPSDLKKCVVRYSASAEIRPAEVSMDCK